MKYIGNFFSLPNEIFLLGLSPGELSVYCYLCRCENQKTHQCWPSYKTIGEAVGMCANTVSRYVKKLDKRRGRKRPRQKHFCPQCGQLRGLLRGLEMWSKSGL